MTVVIGTAGHIDHGKTTLLRALTGIDADRLPEERRRGMTIDVGYAHLALDDGTELDFVDVPGHDKLVGNMLVGAGEIDAALLVVAADDGPRAQTLEHLALLDALGIRDGVAVVTKTDAVEPDRVVAVVEDVRRMLGGTALAEAPVLPVSGATGDGLDALRTALLGVRDAVLARSAGHAEDRPRLAIDRVFSIKGRGVVVTGSLRGGRLERGASLRSVPGDQHARVREIQVHGVAVQSAGPGRTALNLAGVDETTLHRGVVLTTDPDVAASSRLLVRLARPSPDRTRARLHLGTAAVDAAVGRSGRDAIDLPDGSATAILRLAEPIAVAPGDRFVLRRSGGTAPILGGAVIDIDPPRAISRRRQTVERMTRLADSIGSPDVASARAARLELHGAIVSDGAVELAADVAEAAEATALTAVTEAPGSDAPLTAVRSAVARTIRRAATVRREDAAAGATAVLDALVRAGRLVRAGDRLRLPGAAVAAPDPALRGRDGSSRTVAGGSRAPAARRGRPVGGLPAGRDPGAGTQRPDRRPRSGSGIRELDLPGSHGARDRAGPHGPADAGRLPRRDRHEPQVRHGHPRGPRPSRDPAADRCRPCPGPAGDQRPGSRMTAMETVAVIVLAGGRSARFGRDKLAEPLDGRPLLDHVIGAARHLSGEVLIVVTPGSHPLVPDGVRVVEDQRAFEGPLAGVAAGLAATDADIVVVLAGDMPAVRTGVLTRLVDTMTAAGAGAAVLAVGDDRPPLPMAVRRSVAANLATSLLADGQRRLRALPEGLAAAVVPERDWRHDDPDGASLLDIDTPSDLR